MSNVYSHTAPPPELAIDACASASSRVSADVAVVGHSDNGLVRDLPVRLHRKAHTRARARALSHLVADEVRFRLVWPTQRVSGA